MFTKEIRVLDGIQWECTDYSDDALIRLIDNLAKTINKFEVLELCLSDEENGDICIMISIRSAGMQKLGTSRSVYIHKVNYCDEKADLCVFKKEAYRIKRLLKKRYPAICVTSAFNWAYMN